LLPVSSLPRALLLGALWGWLPCGLVYSTLLWAASQGNALQRGVDAGVRAGHLAGVAGHGAGGRAGKRVAQAQVRMAGGLLVMLFGLWTLPGPHQHWLMGH
jgi:sulfite exporter TauE/SafE